MRLAGEAVDRERLPPIGVDRPDLLHRDPARLDEVGPVGLLTEAVTAHPAVGDVEMGGCARAGREAGPNDVRQVDEERHVTAGDSSTGPAAFTAPVAVHV